VWDIPPVRLEKMHWLLPKLRCAACGTVTTAGPQMGRPERWSTGCPAGAVDQ